MSSVVRIAKWLLILGAASALALALIWPWPAPEADWRTPLNAALAENDCRRAGEILHAATYAGAIEAFQVRKELAQRNTCVGELGGQVDRTEALQFFRREDADTPIDPLYRLDQHDLGVLRYGYVRSALFLCARPYNATLQTDFVAISAALPSEGSWIMALHRRRREACIAVLESISTGLVADGDPAANEIAKTIVADHPLTDSITAGFLYAKLLLEQESVSHPFTDERDAERLGYMRVVAWGRLRNAAGAGHLEAIRMMITLLHQGRFRPRDNKEAYFWVLRSRRLGYAGDPSDAEIERTLTDADRLDVKRREERD